MSISQIPLLTFTFNNEKHVLFKEMCCSYVFLFKKTVSFSKMAAKKHKIPQMPIIHPKKQ